MLPVASGTSSFRTTSTASTRPSPRIATGETPKRSTTVFGLPVSGLPATSRIRSTLRRAIAVSSSSAAALAGSRSSAAGSITRSAPASSVSSCSSGVVNAACAGPRRPSTRISRIPEPTIAAIASSVVSVGSISSAVSASIRATSTATFPFPTTTTRSAERSNGRSWKSGWPLYQATNAVAGHEPGRSSPGMFIRLSACAPKA